MLWMKWSIRNILRLIWVAGGIVFTFWLLISMNAKGISKAIFESDKKVQISRTDDYISFTPTSPYERVVIFYPGALVDPDAYAPLCRKLADNGLQSMIIKMPWNWVITRRASQGKINKKKFCIISWLLLTFINNPPGGGYQHSVKDVLPSQKHKTRFDQE